MNSDADTNISVDAESVTNIYIYVSMFSGVTLTHNIENYLFLNAINTNNIPHWVEKCYHLINNIMQMASTKNTKLKGVCS